MRDQDRWLAPARLWCGAVAVTLAATAVGCGQSDPIAVAEEPPGGDRPVAAGAGPGENAAKSASALSFPEFEPGAVREAARERAAKAAEKLSPQQQRYLTRFGQPDAFSIIFSHDDPADPRRLVRTETWQYYDADFAVLFVDGQFIDSDELEPATTEHLPGPYWPGEFVAGMTRADLFARYPGLERTGVKLPKELMPDTEMYAYRQLLVGFHGDDLMYVESAALEPQEQEGDAP